MLVFKKKYMCQRFVLFQRVLLAKAVAHGHVLCFVFREYSNFLEDTILSQQKQHLCDFVYFFFEQIASDGFHAHLIRIMFGLDLYYTKVSVDKHLETIQGELKLWMGYGKRLGWYN